MSNDPHNPFSRQGAGDRFDSPAPKKSNRWLWVIGIIGGLGLLGILVCCGSVFFAFQFGAGMLGEEVKAELQGNPTIREHLGDVESAKMNLTATAQENQEQAENDLLVFDVQGSQASGRVVVRQQAGGIQPQELILNDGTRHPLTSADDFTIDDGDLGIPAFDDPDERASEDPDDADSGTVDPTETAEQAFP